jgi:hypothetical protein
MTDRKKPGVGFWTTVVAVVVLILLYPLSLGPAIWLTARGYFRESVVQSIYRPFLVSAEYVEIVESAVTWWGSLGVPDNKAVTFIYETWDGDCVFQFTRTGEAVPTR